MCVEDVWALGGYRMRQRVQDAINVMVQVGCDYGDNMESV